MGIYGLTKLIADKAPNAVTTSSDLKKYLGRRVAIDASMSLYQFLIAVRSEGTLLTTVDGETTSHLMGIFHRTIKLVENGIKPVYVFDGKPPEMKSGELNKRMERREEAQKALKEAEESGDAELVDKFSRRLVKVTKHHIEECKRLLTLMGIPYIEAPCEAEAQCAALVKAGKVYAIGTEDMDALTFGSSVVLRHLTSSDKKKMPIQEFHFNKVLTDLGLNISEFIDLCILLGCDYCGRIKGIGSVRALDLIQQHRSIETIIENLDQSKYPIPENWMYKGARELFLHPEVIDPESIELKWAAPDEEGMVKYLCGEKNFSEERVRNGAKKLLKGKSSSTQGRLDSFFKTLPSSPSNQTDNKRKAGEKKTPLNKKAKTGNLGGRKPK